jgi:hypothetical protein
VRAPAFVPTHAERARDFATVATVRPALDTLEPPPTATALLTAEEAKERLREIVDRFFFRHRDGQGQWPARQLLVRSPPGLGKTTQAVELAIRYQAEQAGKDGARLSVDDLNEAGVPAQTSIFVPRHQLAVGLREMIEGAFRERGELITVPVLRGRENGGEEGNAPCRRWREAHELARKRLPIYTNPCQRTAEGQAFQCPLFRRLRVHPDAAGGLFGAVRDPRPCPSRSRMGRDGG